MAEVMYDAGYKQVGKRVRYIEPNYTTSIPMQGNHGLHSYEFANPLEDYCIFVNLKVEIRGRAIRTDYTTESQTITMNYYSEQGHSYVSFMQGSEYPTAQQNARGKKAVNSLTTNYYDHMYINDLIKRDENGVIQETDTTNEVFGINSIDIDYNNWMVPQVTIKFTDIRGVSLFAPEEARHHLYDDKTEKSGLGDLNVEGSFFKSFFTQPYPKFTLTVKGFYGQAVAYELTCADFRASFNSETGNFEATAKFIGSFYSFLSDVTVNCITAAPYSDFLGKKYWDENVSNGRFWVKDNNDQQVSMPTIGQFIAKLDEAMTTASATAASSSAAQESAQLDDQNQKITGITQAYNAYLQAIRTAVGKQNAGLDSTTYAGWNFFIEDNGNFLFFVPDMDSGDDLDDFDDDDVIEDAYDALEKTVDGSDSGTTQYKDMIKRLDPDDVNAIQVYDSNGIIVNDSTVGTPIMNAVRNNWQVSLGKRDSDGTLIDREDLQYAIYFKGGDLAKNLGLVKQNNDAAIQENQDEIAQIQNDALADSLGFKPSLENITRILMAHFETFCYMVTECARQITGQSRTCDTLGVTQGNLPDLNGSINSKATENGTTGLGVSQQDMIVPPFPKVTKHITENGFEKDEEAWIGDFPGDWLEEDLVNGLLNGINEMAKIAASSSAGTASDGGALTAIMKTPLSPMDLILNKKPYGDDINFDDKSDFAGRVILRALSLLGLNDEIYSNYNQLGRTEASNFIDFFGNNPNQNFKQWISGNTVVDDIINIASASNSTPVSKYGKNNKYSWEHNRMSASSHVPLITSNGGTCTLNLYHGGEKNYLPVQNMNFTAINQDFGMPNENMEYSRPRNFDNYISTYGRSAKTYKDSSFEATTAGKLICIEPNADRFQTIITNQCKDDTSKNVFQDATYNAADFKKFIDNWEYIKKSPQGVSTPNTGDGSSSESDDSQTRAFSIGVSANTESVDDWEDKYDDAEDAFKSDSSHNVDNYRIIYLPDVNGDNSLFTSRDYLSATNEERAYKFLQAIGKEYVDYDETIGKIIDNDKQFAIVPWASILYLGALCHISKANNYSSDKIKEYGGDTDWLDPLRYDVMNDLEKFFMSWLDSDFSKIDSYMVLQQSSSPNNKEIGIAPETIGSLYITRVTLKPYVFLKTSNKFFEFQDKSANDKLIKSANVKEFLNGFVAALREAYSNSSSDTTDTADIERAQDCNTDTDIKLGVYRYCKLLYDKWIASSVFENEFTMEKFFGENTDSTTDDGRMFYFIDNFYNRIGNLVLINPGKLKDDIISAELGANYNLAGFLSRVYSVNKCNFLCVQNFMDLADEQKVKDTFKPIALMDMDRPKVTPNFIAMYIYEASSHLDNGSDGNHKDDSFGIRDAAPNGNGNDVDKWPAPLNSGEDSGYYIPAFGVSYGKQYQSYFNNISVSMENPMVTDQSLTAQYEIASQNNDHAMNTTDAGTAQQTMVTMGQDLFTVYSNASYTCEVDMMGDAWIQPMMYFELLNIPMFRGTYFIEKVSHHIEAGKMTTHFTGVRMARITNKLKKGWFWRENLDDTGGESLEEREGELASPMNDCNYKTYGAMGGTLAGTKFSANGISLMFNCEGFSGGDLKHPERGATAENVGDGKATVGPGLTNSVWKGLHVGQRCSGNEIRTHFATVLQDETKQIQQYCPNVFQLPQGCIDAMYLLAHAGPGHVQGFAKKFKGNRVSDFVNAFREEAPMRGGFTGGLAKRWACCIAIANGSHQAEGSFKGASCPGDTNTVLGKYYNPDAGIVQWAGGTVPAVNDKTKTDNSNNKGLWDEFVTAVQYTSQNTPSCGLNVGSQKKSKDSGWLMVGDNGTGGRDKLAVVFDIILMTYMTNVEKMAWIADTNNVKGGPIRLEIVLAKKPSDVRVGVVMNGSAGFMNQVDGNFNETYRRSVIKYKNKVNQNIWNGQIRTKPANGDDKKLQPQLCSELLSSEGFDNGAGEQFVADKMIGDWNAGKAANHAIKHAQPSTKHQCATYVRQAVNSGGGKPQKACGLGNGYRAGRGLTKYGFVQILAGKTNDSGYSSYKPMLGDIMCMTKGNDFGYWGHICMFCGQQYGWISDFKQSSPYVYPNSGPGNFWVYRYKG